MSKFETRERFVATWEQALRNAGMQSSLGTELKPKYWRGQVNNDTSDLFLLYVVTGNEPLEYADNKSIRRDLYINGQLFTRSGFTDSDYHDLAVAIERECEALGLFCTFDDENINNAIDTESPVFYVNFEVNARLRNN